MRGALGFSLDEAIFRPRLASGPSGLADPPRGFVLCAAHLNGAVVQSGETFEIECRTFDREGRVAADLASAFDHLRDARFRLDRVRPGAEFAIDLSRPQPAAILAVRFVTPAELKGCPAQPEITFATLLARVRDRVATLSRLYGNGAMAADFRGLGERAVRVRTIASELSWREIRRRSSRTGDVHSIGGFIGRATYAGDLAEFAPWLRAACWTGVGRHTVWGNGQIECEFAA